MSMPAEIMNPAPTLANLLDGLADAPPVPVSGIASDSRLLGEGYLFLACQGIGSHGIDYLGQALEKNIAAVAYDSDTAAAPTGLEIPAVGVPGLGQHLGEIANRFYGSPSDSLDVIGVTGTNGKTTVAWMIEQCLGILGHRSAYIGTLGSGAAELRISEGMTTPACIELHEQLAGFVEEGASHAAIEVSSHALSQGRIDGVRIAAALFTNLSRDHLDYHDSMQDYFDTKAKLFLDYDAPLRIINLDTEYGTELAARCGQEVVTVSTNFDRVANGRPYVFVRSVVATSTGSEVTFVSSWGDGLYLLPIPGDFNVANATLALAYLLGSGVELEDACEALGNIEAPPGRMQRVARSSVYVDYAHTPDALESALQALRPHCRGKLWCVFGAGGDRDAGKRPEMGAIVERRADRAVVTTDNPRSESPAAIIDDITAGMKAPTVIEDRAAAIAWAIKEMGPDDALLIAGKGHENYQEVNGERLSFSDWGVAFGVLRGFRS